MADKSKANWLKDCAKREDVLASMSMGDLEGLILAVEKSKDPELMGRMMTAIQAAGHDRLRNEIKKNPKVNRHYGDTLGMRFLDNPTQEFLMAAMMSDPGMVNRVLSPSNGSDRVFPENMRTVGNKMLDIFDAIVKMRKENELRKQYHPIRSMVYLMFARITRINEISL